MLKKCAEHQRFSIPLTSNKFKRKKDRRISFLYKNDRNDDRLWAHLLLTENMNRKQTVLKCVSCAVNKPNKIGMRLTDAQLITLHIMIKVVVSENACVCPDVSKSNKT